MINAIVLDDEPPALEIVQAFCNRTDFINLQKAFTKAGEALSYLNKFPVDLLFLDINMPSVSGLEFSKKITQQTMIIFTTAYAEYAIDGFNLNAVDYLLKPFTYNRFLKAAEKANARYRFIHHSKATGPQYILLRVDHSMVKVYFEDILFIEGLDDYIKIHRNNDKPLVTRMTMKALNDKLPQTVFIRVHRSFIVPFNKIDYVRNRVINISGEEISIGASFEKEFLFRFKV